MTEQLINKAKQRTIKSMNKAVKDRKAAVERGDTVSELSLSDKIEDYNTILSLIDAALENTVFNNYIMDKFTRIN